MRIIQLAYAMLPERLQTTLHKENVPFNVNGLCNLAYAICNVLPQAPSNISQEKNHAIQGMLFQQHLVTLFTYVYISGPLRQKNIKLSATRDSTQQPVKLLVGHYLEN